MFLMTQLFNSEKLNQNEMQILNKYFNLYKNTEYGTWFKDIDTSKLTFYWCKGMNDQNQVLGAWNPLFYNSIYLKWFDRSVLTRK